MKYAIALVISSCTVFSYASQPTSKPTSRPAKDPNTPVWKLYNKPDSNTTAGAVVNLLEQKLFERMMSFLESETNQKNPTKVDKVSREKLQRELWNDCVNKTIMVPCQEIKAIDNYLSFKAEGTLPGIIVLFNSWEPLSSKDVTKWQTHISKNQGKFQLRIRLSGEFEVIYPPLQGDKFKNIWRDASNLPFCLTFFERSWATKAGQRKANWEIVPPLPN